MHHCRRYLSAPLNRRQLLSRAACGFGALALLLRILSLGKLTDFNRKYLVAGSSRLVLYLMGIKLIAPPASAFPKDPVFYTFNHNSYLDILILTALGLPNNRFLLSEKTLKFIPLTLSALGIGTLYIPLKKAREMVSRRRACAVSASTSRGWQWPKLTAE